MNSDSNKSKKDFSSTCNRSDLAISVLDLRIMK